MQALRSAALVILVCLIPGFSSAGDCPPAESIRTAANEEAAMVALAQEYPGCADICIALGNYYYDRSIWKAAHGQYIKAVDLTRDSARFESRITELQSKMGMSIAAESDLETLRGISGLKKLPPLIVKVHFDTNSSTIRPESEKLLFQFAEVLKTELAGKKFHIQGHTDNVGSYEFNLRLSKARAQSVYDHLVMNLHVDPSRFDVEAFSFEKPVDTNLTPQGRQNNRRVQFQAVH